MTPEQRKKQFNNIAHSVATMTNLLDDVLMMGRSEIGKSLNIINFDLINTIKSITENIIFIDNRKHKFILDMPSRMTIKSDKTLVDHIINNLIMNAVKYSPRNTEVFVGVKELKSDEIEFFLEDRGIGIPKEDIANIFDSFFISSNTGSIEGTGLGMSIVKKSIDSLDGKIDIESKESEGTKVRVILPINSEI
jgi:signal transduction histidine kinase